MSRATLVYSPAVSIRIETDRHGILDVSPDLVDGTVTRVQNGVSSVSFTLANHRRKYDQVFMPNDRIHVALKRIRWMPILTGYLNTVPYMTTYPRTVRLDASCSLKYLQHFLWDPGFRESVDFMREIGDGHSEKVDGGIKYRVERLLTDVARWQKDRIHIGEVPEEWFRRAGTVRDRLDEEVFQQNQEIIGGGATIGGQGSAGGGMEGQGSIEGIGPGTGQLSHTSGKITWFGGPGGGAYGVMNLTGESGLTPRDPWYCAMRFPYYRTDPNSGMNRRYLPAEQERAAMQWWRNRRLLVTNPANGKQIVVRAADWGPRGGLNPDRVIDVSKQALGDLGASTFDNVQIAFAPENASLGPVRGMSLRGAGGEGVDSSNGSSSSDQDVRVSGGSHTQAAQSVTFRSGDSLQPHTYAARQFIQQAWDLQYGIGGYRNDPRSGHGRGLALDVMVSPLGQMPDAQGIAIGNGVTQWFLSNPDAFDLNYIIWWGQINTGTGWRRYGSSRYNVSSVTGGHYDHPHIEFNSPGVRSLGPMGNPWPGADMQSDVQHARGTGFTGDIAGGGGLIGGVDGGGFDQQGLASNLINAFQWLGQSGDHVSNLLSGPLALMNNQPILPFIEGLLTAGMRKFCSAPNGDFISWFPDYFGLYGLASRMRIEDIELQDFNVQWSDHHLVTHQYVYGAPPVISAFTNMPGGSPGLQEMLGTEGVVTVDMDDVLDLLLNISSDEGGWADGQKILQRFGARVQKTGIGTITGPEAEFWMAISLFQENWARQFTATVPLTFMPELYPGMLLYLPKFRFQAYIEEVSHSFNFGSGGRFSTTVRISAPSATHRNGGLYGLPQSEDPTRGQPSGGGGRASVVR